MSRADGDDDGASTVPHPRETSVLFGHTEAEQTLLAAYRSGRSPHAWLIGGPHGIGKATLAYRMARFVLSHADPAVPAVQSATSLAVDPESRVARRIAAQGHTDLLVLERTLNDKGQLRTVITVDEARRSVSFFGSTAGEGGWRLCIVDAADELHPSAANALLKVVEEPPPRSMFLIVSHAPGRLLPTIRSRCSRLSLRPLTSSDVAQAAAAALGRAVDDAEIAEASGLAEGSVASAIALLGGPMLALRKRVAALLDALPATDPRALHSVSDTLPLNETRMLGTFVDAVRGWLSARLNRAGRSPTELARLADAFGRVDRDAREVAEYNLDRRPFVFSVFGLLAEAAR